MFVSEYLDKVKAVWASGKQVTLQRSCTLAGLVGGRHPSPASPSTGFLKEVYFGLFLKI